MSHKKGFTLKELIIVIAILALLGAIAVPGFTGLIDRSRQSTDLYNLEMLNSVTRVAAVQYTGPEDNFYNMFSGLDNDDSRWNYLVDDVNVISNQFEPKRSGYSFIWSEDFNLWLYQDSQGNLFYFSFNGQGGISLEDFDKFKPRYNGRGWEITEGGLRSDFSGNAENVLYIDPGNPGREYAISVDAVMNDGPGYGVFFDTIGEGNTETGFSVQFERSGSGRIIIRPRVNGNERFNLNDLGVENLQDHYLFDNLSEDDRARLSAGENTPPILHTYSFTPQQREMMEQGNNMRLEVRDGEDGKRVLDVYLGEEKVIDNFLYNVADPDNPIETSGLRVWNNAGYNGENVRFESVDIYPVD